MNTVEILSNLINIPSYDITNNKELTDYLTNLLKDKVVEIKLIPCEGNILKNSMIIGVNTTLKNIENAVILSAHLDTVTQQVFKTAKVDEDKLYGLGSCDMKAFIANILYNLDYLKNYPLPVILCFTADEETKLRAIEEVVEFIKENNISAKFALLGEPTNLNLVVANKGCMEYKVTIKGKPAHSSNPSLGINAIKISTALINLVTKLNNRYFKKGISLNVGKIEGGKQVNIVPDVCDVYFDLRLKNMQQKDMILNKINNLLIKLEKQYKTSITFEEILFIPPNARSNSKLIQDIITKLNLTVEEANYGTEAGYYNLLGITSLVFGAGDIAQAHSENEFVYISNLEKFNDYLIQLLEIIK